MNAVLNVLLGVYLTCESAVYAAEVCDETCLLQHDLQVSHRQKSIAEMEKEAELKSISNHGPAAKKSGETDKAAVVGSVNRTLEEDKVDLDEEADEAEEADEEGKQASFAFSSFETLYKQVEYELGWDHTPKPPPMKNKALLILFEVTVVPAFFGIDRCYMGQACHGMVKGMTFGGLGLWAVLDNLAVFINTVQESHSIDVLGLKANFHIESVHPAYNIAVWAAAIAVALALGYFCVGVCYHAHRGQKKEYEAQSTPSDTSVRYRSVTHGGIGVRRI
jgi:hypothetical protein